MIIINSVRQCYGLVQSHHWGCLCSVCEAKRLQDVATEFCAPRHIVCIVLSPLLLRVWDLTELKLVSLWCARVDRSGSEVMAHC